MKNIKILAIISIVVLSACTNTEKNTDFDKGPMLENIAFNLAIPAYETSLAAFQNLDSALHLLNENPNEKNLITAQNYWKKASSTWAKTAPYNFGPIDELLIENYFHYFPVDTSKLESALEKELLVDELGSNIRGLAALEYLLFSKNSSFHSTNVEFAKLLCENLIKLNREVLTNWKSGYAKEFASSTGNDLNASMTILTNQWIEIAETIKNNKIGLPAGKSEGGERNVSLVQAPYSKNSLSLIKSNLIALQRSFNGGNAKGVDDYLSALEIRDSENQLLNEKINSQFESIIDLLKDDTNDLSELIQNNPDKVDQIYLEILNLSIVLKTDLMGQLGLITTFSDSDGD